MSSSMTAARRSTLPIVRFSQLLLLSVLPLNSSDQTRSQPSTSQNDAGAGCSTSATSGTGSVSLIPAEVMAQTVAFARCAPALVAAATATLAGPEGTAVALSVIEHTPRPPAANTSMPTASSSTRKAR